VYSRRIERSSIKQSAASGFAFPVGERDFKDKMLIITGPPLTFTAENIDKFHF
jgi:hypothetical protein